MADRNAKRSDGLSFIIMNKMNCELIIKANFCSRYILKK